MDRKEVMDKIRAMMSLKEGTSFEAEADNAARMIDRLCEKYGVTVSDAMTPEVLTETFQSFKRFNSPIAVLLSSVARFYDSVAFVDNRNKELKILGTEAQQIQVRLYFEYLHDCMEKECKKALAGEKLLASLIGATPPTKNFSNNFRIAFSQSVKERLTEMKKAENRIHDDAEHTKNAAALIRIRWW